MKLKFVLVAIPFLAMIGMAIAYYFFDMDILFQTPMSLTKSMYYKSITDFHDTHPKVDSSALLTNVDVKFTPLYKGQRPKPKKYGVRVTRVIFAGDPPYRVSVSSSRTYWFHRKYFIWRECFWENFDELQRYIKRFDQLEKRFEKH